MKNPKEEPRWISGVLESQSVGIILWKIEDSVSQPSTSKPCDRCINLFPKRYIVTIAYNHELDICTLCPVQVVSRSKVVSALEFDLEPEIEQLAATRQVDRLTSYRFLCAISIQISQLTSGKLSLPSFVAPLSMYLGPLQEDKKRITQGGHVFIKDVGTGNICQPDLSDAMNVPILSVSIDQGGVGAASWLTSLEFLFNWDTCDFDNFIFQ